VYVKKKNESVERAADEIATNPALDSELLLGG
jgi:hypothetical protein